MTDTQDNAQAPIVRDDLDVHVGAYVTQLEDQIRRYEDRLVKIAGPVGRIKAHLDHSRDRCDTATDLRADVNDLLDALGAR